MNLYKYHTNPETLLGHEHKHIITPGEALFYLKMHIEDFAKYDLNLKDFHLAAKFVGKNSSECLDFILETGYPVPTNVPNQNNADHDRYAQRCLSFYIRKDSNEKFKPFAYYTICNNTITAYAYAEYQIGGPFPDGEDAIAKDPEKAVQYARYILDGQFKKGEKSIASNPMTAFVYAYDVIEDRFPEGEKAISSSKVKDRYNERFGTNL